MGFRKEKSLNELWFGYRIFLINRFSYRIIIEEFDLYDTHVCALTCVCVKAKLLGKCLSILLSSF